MATLSHIENERERLLTQPSSVAKRVADIVESVAPTVNKPKYSKFSDPVEAVEANMPQDHPMKGLASQIYQDASTIISDPLLKYQDPNTIISAVAKARINDPELIDKTFSYKRRADSAVNNWYGIFGEDKKVRALPGYEQWLSERQALEDVASKEDGWFASLGDIAEQAAWGAGIGGALGSIGLGPGAVGGAISGGTVAAALEVPLHPLKRLLHDTEWYRSRSESPELSDRLKATAADLVGLTGVVMGAPKIAAKGIAKAAASGLIDKEGQDFIGTALEKLYISKPSAPDIGLGGSVARVRLAGENLPTKVFDDLAKINSMSLDAATSMEAFGKRPSLENTVRLARINRDAAKFDSIVKKVDARLSGNDIIYEMLEGSEAGLLGSNVGQPSTKIVQPYMEGLDLHTEILARKMAARRAGGAGNVGIGRGTSNIAAEMEPGEVPATLIGESRPIIANPAGRGPGIPARIYRDPLGGKSGQEVFESFTSEEMSRAAEFVLQGNSARVATGIVYTDRKVAEQAAKQDKYIYDSFLAGGTPKESLATLERSATAMTERAAALDTKLAREWQWSQTQKSLADALNKKTSTRVTAALEEGHFQEELPDLGAGSFDDVTRAIEKNAQTRRDRLMSAGLDAGEVSRMTHTELLIAEDSLTGRFQPGTFENLARELSETEAPVITTGLEEDISSLFNKITGEKPVTATSLSTKAELASDVRKATKGFQLGIKPLGMAMIPLAMLGSIPLGTVLDPNVQTADAGMLSETVSKVTVPFLKLLRGSGTDTAKIMSEVESARLNRFTVANNTLVLPRPQEAVRVAQNLPKIETVRKDVSHLPFKIDRYMTNYSSGEIWYHPTMNPQVEMAAAQEAAIGNANNALKVKNNILRLIPGYEKTKNASVKEAEALFEPLAKQYSGDVIAYRSLTFELDRMEKIHRTLQAINARTPERGELVSDAITKAEARIDKLRSARDGINGDIDADKLIRVNEELDKASRWYNKVRDARNADNASPEDLAEAAATVDRLTKAKSTLTPSFDEFNLKMDAMEQYLAKKYPGVRVSLAAEDTTDFAFRPWLKGLLSKDEEIATNYVKSWFSHYTDRLDEIGVDTIKSRPFVHHAWHPAWNKEAALKRLNDIDPGLMNGLPYSDFFERTMYSRQLMPEIGYNMERYAIDAEKRIQMIKFWDKSNPEGWWQHSMSDFVRTNPALNEFWTRTRQSSVPAADTTANQWANRYTAFEALRLLGGSVSVPFKHFFKQTGTAATLGVGETFGAMRQGAKTAFKLWANESAQFGMLKRLGIDAPKLNAVDEFVKGFVHQNYMQNVLTEFEMSPFPKTMVDKFFDKANQIGGSIVGAIEAFDRSVSVLAATSMAQKQGLTAHQAVYGIYDTVLKNNFLGGMMNASWMKDPKIRAVMLFQSTPAKILERRLTLGIKSYQDIKTAVGVIKKEKAPVILAELKDLMLEMAGGEALLKENQIKAALTQHKDVFGTPATKQFMKELLITGAVIGGGGAIGLDLAPQLGHLPFFKAEATDPAIALSPAIGAVFRANASQAKQERLGEDPDMWLSTYMREWLGKPGVLPLTMYKAMRISEDDIPERYKGSWMQYLFAIPSKKGSE